MKIHIVNEHKKHNQTLAHLSSIAWVNSRPAEDIDTLDHEMVKQLDLPVNEFTGAFLFVQSTILEREFFTSMRNHVMWAQTSRVQNILEFKMPEWIGDYENEYFQLVRNEMIESSKTERQDDFRMSLPIMSITKYNLRISVREIIHIISFLRSMQESGDYNHLKIMISEFISEMEMVASSLGYPSEAIDYSKFKKADIFREIENNEEGTIGDVVVVSASISFSLRAQLIRHRGILIQDNMMSMMKNNSIIFANQSTIFDVKIICSKKDAIQIIRNRSCWVAQYNLWSPLINKIENMLNLGSSSLPCHDGSCPFEKDAELRLTQKDPNAPCPIHARITGAKLKESHIHEMTMQWKKDERPMFWRSEIMAVSEANFQKSNKEL